MTSILGLPAHPLFAHIPVVLIPLAALGAVAMLWPSIRNRLGWVVVGLVFVAGISTQLAITSGQNLEEYVRETRLMHDHVKMGESIRPWVLLMFLALLAVMVVAHLARRVAATAADADPASTRTRARLKYVGIAAMTAALLFSAMATFTIVRIGHSGSKAVWQPTKVKIDTGRGEGGGSDEG